MIDQRRQLHLLVILQQQDIARLQVLHQRQIQAERRDPTCCFANVTAPDGSFEELLPVAESQFFSRLALCCGNHPTERGREQNTGAAGAVEHNFLRDVGRLSKCLVDRQVGQMAGV